jgi:hypothetical protein
MDEADLYRNKPLGQVLKLMELVNEGHIQEALQIQRKQGGLIGQILVSLGYVAQDEVFLALAAQRGSDETGSDRQIPTIP